ncbi:general stress protein [Georgenia alba]|uniref:General stress protein n=1 Tax=Georgenia alba TaxID=2233858 RepID=A0ABW2QA92_9MICO
MSLSGKAPGASVPTMPTGVEVASYSTYLEAQKAVDYLSDKAFPVQKVTIVGTDLRLVERITGRLTYARVAGAGAMSGAWFGLLISLLLLLFTPSGQQFPILAGVLMGAAFGILAGVVSYALTGGRRDFTSASQVVASRYAVLCEPEEASRAGEVLTEGGFAGRVRPSAGQPSTPQQPNAPQQPSFATPPEQPGGSPTAGAGSPTQAPEQRERPRYGLRLEDVQGQQGHHGQRDQGGDRDGASGEAGSRG